MKNEAEIQLETLAATIKKRFERLNPTRSGLFSIGVFNALAEKYCTEYLTEKDHVLIYSVFLNRKHGRVCIAGFYYCSGSALSMVDPSAFESGVKKYLKENAVKIKSRYFYASDLCGAMSDIEFMSNEDFDALVCELIFQEERRAM